MTPVRALTLLVDGYGEAEELSLIVMAPPWLTTTTCPKELAVIKKDATHNSTQLIVLRLGFELGFMIRRYAILFE